MNYDNFSKWFNEELPFNRKEKFFTGTVLPALLFNNGLSNFYHFLRAINNFPAEVNEESTGDNFIFFTEYNLKEASGDRNIGRKISTEGKTPDVVIEILKPQRVFVLIEAKMFEKFSQPGLNKQIMEQKRHVAEPLKNEFGLETDQIFHIALIPKALKIDDNDLYQVFNWEFFIDNEKVLNLKSCYFYNYLRFAIENYEALVAKGSPPPPYTKMSGQQIYQDGKNNGTLWVGKQGGEKAIIEEDIKSGEWETREYYVNNDKPKSGRKGNWITSKRFAELVDKYGKG